MTTLHQKRNAKQFKPMNDVAADKRTHRRYDLGGQTLMINRWDASRRSAAPLGYLMDLSAGGVAFYEGAREYPEDKEMAAFVDSVVNDLIMPIVSKLFGGLDFSNYFIPLSGQTADNLADAKKAGAVIAYGNFVTVSINFAILAFIIVLMVRQINRLRRAEPAPPPPSAPPEELLVLREIRDSLRAR